MSETKTVVVYRAWFDGVYQWGEAAPYTLGEPMKALPAAEFDALVRRASDAKRILRNLLDDTQHEAHLDCEDGPCPVREAREFLDPRPRKAGRDE